MSPQTDPTAGAEARIDPLISLSTRDLGTCHLVTVAGEVDMATSPSLLRYLEQQDTQAGTILVLDLRKVAFLGSSGLAVLVQVLSRLEERGMVLRLVCNSHEVLRPLEATGLNTLFEIHSDLETALAEPGD